MRKKDTEAVWNVGEALARLRTEIDPYIWEQGQELYRRGAVEDFSVSADGSIQVVVLDPRDSRRFFVRVERRGGGEIRARCACPYRLGGLCRHQVVALEYLRAASEGQLDEAERREEPQEAEGAGTGDSAVKAAGPVLYRLDAVESGVAATPDGSLLRAVLHSLGALGTPHRLGLQLYTGTGWTEIRTPDVDRWIERGASGPHPRDEVIAGLLRREGSVGGEFDSEDFARLLVAVAGSRALVDRSGRPLDVSLAPWFLAARLEKGAEGGVSVRLECRAYGDGDPAALEEVAIVPSLAPWIQLESGTFHPLAAGASGRVLAALQEEVLEGELYVDMRGSALDRLLEEGMEKLHQLCPGRVETTPGLIEEVEGVTGARLRLEGSAQRLSGLLELRYGDHWVAAPDSPTPWTETREGKVHRYPAAGQSLARARAELETLGFRRDEGRWILEGSGILARVLGRRPGAFVALQLPESLETFDLVTRAPRLRVRVGGLPALGAAAGDGSGEGVERPARQGPGTAWLDVSPALFDGDRELPIDVESLLAAREDDPRGVVELADGTVLRLEHEAVGALAELCHDRQLPRAPSPGKGKGAGISLELPLACVGELLEEVPGRDVQIEEGIRNMARELREAEPARGPVLAEDVDAILRPYQREAVDWFGRLSRWGLSGILADEMGLGKTLMALAHFFGERDRPPAQGAGADGGPQTVLVVCPSSLVFNWLDETRRFFPQLRAAGLYGESPPARRKRIEDSPELLVTSYALLRRDREVLESREFRAVVLDEAQHIKNADSQAARAACALRAREKWALTGTPVENHLGELWSLFSFLMQGFLGTRKGFQQRFAAPIAGGDTATFERLRRRIRPFLLRRTKEQVLKDLPARIEQVERVPMTEVQRRLYASVLLDARGDIEAVGGAGARFRLLAALTRLRQVCCHPRLVAGQPDASSCPDGAAKADDDLTAGKFDLVRELLESSLEEGRKVLLYSQFTTMLDLFEPLLDAMDALWVRLDGSTRDREDVVRRFQEDEAVRVFLISLKAGGLGLNLTAADTVIIYDPWWNPAAEAQAAARAHRLGQTAPVHVHKLITRDTVEEKILTLQEAKRDLAQRLVESGEEALGALSLQELETLLFED